MTSLREHFWRSLHKTYFRVYTFRSNPRIPDTERTVGGRSLAQWKGNRLALVGLISPSLSFYCPSPYRLPEGWQSLKANKECFSPFLKAYMLQWGLHDRRRKSSGAFGRSVVRWSGLSTVLSSGQVAFELKGLQTAASYELPWPLKSSMDYINKQLCNQPRWLLS